MKASVFVSTYDMPVHLELVLEGLFRQSIKEFEILVCDDGSSDETRSLIDRLKSRSPVKVQHFWQEHQGFRKCKILNEALKNAKGEISIFLDGDCVPYSRFVEDHIQNQEHGRYLAGRRVELGPEFSAKLTPEMIDAGYLEGPSLGLFVSVFKKESQHFQRSIRFSLPLLRKILKLDRIDDLKGCNYSVLKKHLIEINGFDEEYEGYGREDTDIEIRLQNLGLKIKSMKGLALQYHVWHPRRGFTPSNDARLEEAKATRRVRCIKGMTQS